jgi:hypothetical protein
MERNEVEIKPSKGMQNAMHLNNKSVELLRAKFQPNTGLSPDALKKFF